MKSNPRFSPLLAVLAPALFSALVLFATLPALAAATTTLFVPAVNPDGGGTLTAISATVLEGNGVPPGVYFDVEPFINVDTQESGRTAARIAAEEANAPLAGKAVLYKITSDASSVDGPSGGHALALLAYAELARKAVRTDYKLGVTGTIEIDATVGSVGGVAEKLQAAAGKGVTLFLVPVGQSEADGVDYAGLADELTNGRMRVLEVADLRESAGVVFAAPGTPLPVFQRPEIKFTPAPIATLLSPAARSFEAIAGRTLEKAAAAVNALEAKAKANAAAPTVQPANTNATENGNATAGGNATLPLVSNFTLANLRRQLNESRTALNAGYAYTAANTAFLAKIRAETFLLVLDNVSSEELLDRVHTLQKEMTAFKPGPSNEANWQQRTGAQLRYYWALLTLEDANASLTDSAPAVEYYSDYATAANWFSAARELHALADDECQSCPALDLTNARGLALQKIEEMNETIVDDPEVDIHARGAERAFESGDFATSVFDASFVTAFAQAEADLEDKTARDVYALLRNETALRGYAGSQWAQLYYSHAWYSQQHANQTRNIASLVNALKLDRLAAQLNNQTLALDAAFRGVGAGAGASVEPGPFTPANATGTPAVSVSVQTTPDGTKLVLAATLIAIVLLGLYLALNARAHRTPPAEHPRPLEREPRSLSRARVARPEAARKPSRRSPVRSRAIK